MTLTRATDVLEAARSIEPLLEKEAAAIEAAGTLTTTTVAALREAGLFHFLVPRELGGTEVDIDTALDLFEIAGHANPAVGWCVLVNATVTAAAAAYFGDEAARVVFGKGDAILAGALLLPAGTARPKVGGYQFSGRSALAVAQDTPRTSAEAPD